MSKKDQVLVIEPPNELTFTGNLNIFVILNIEDIYCFFPGPFTAAVSSYMKLKNPSDKKVCFKIKTTAPKRYCHIKFKEIYLFETRFLLNTFINLKYFFTRYCVKPNSGVVDPHKETAIAVSLQPFDYDPSTYIN